MYLCFDNNMIYFYVHRRPKAMICFETKKLYLLRAIYFFVLVLLNKNQNI